MSGPPSGIGRVIRFALVGSTGFLVDAGLLVILNDQLGLDPLSARLISVSAAVAATWRLNRRLTFGPSGNSQTQEGVRYSAVAAGNAVLNYLLYALALMLWPALPPLVAIIGATLVSMVFSYLGYSRLVFASGRSAILESPRLHRR